MNDFKMPNFLSPNRFNIAAISLVLMFLIILIVNFIATNINFRIDLTENKVYTLSEGTKNILKKLDSPVNIRYYVTSDSKVMSPSQRARARRVEDLLNEFKNYAPVKTIETTNQRGEFEKKKIKMLSIKKLNPEPDTDAEDEATVDGLKVGIDNQTNQEIYFGIVIQSLNLVETIPFVPAREEEMLEYDIARAISSVHNGKEKKIAIMTDLQIQGGRSFDFKSPPKRPWMFYELISKSYEVIKIPTSTTKIPDSISTLIVLHPNNISDESQFAIDQYLLEGGSVILLVDSSFYFARAISSPRQQQIPGIPPQGAVPTSSDLPKLFSAWGVKYESNKILADLNYATRLRDSVSPVYLTFNNQSFQKSKKKDPITSMISSSNMLTPGGFKINPPEGVKLDTLLMSSNENQLVDSAGNADPAPKAVSDNIRKNFKASDKPHILIARLSGSFYTAFPKGPPVSKDKPAKDANKKEDNKDNKKLSFIKKSSKPGQILLISDVDFIYDDFVVTRQQIQGLGISIPRMMNENLTILQNTTEQFSGDPDLIKVRSRSSVRRPFTRPDSWHKEVRTKYDPQINAIREKANESKQALSNLLSRNPKDINQALLSAEAQKELKDLRKQSNAYNKKVRELEKEMAREFRRKLNIYKVLNSAFVPALIIIFGIGLTIYRKKQTMAR